jgi:hypothetical protein
MRMTATRFTTDRRHCDAVSVWVGATESAKWPCDRYPARRLVPTSFIRVNTIYWPAKESNHTGDRSISHLWRSHDAGIIQDLRQPFESVRTRDHGMATARTTSCAELQRTNVTIAMQFKLNATTHHRGSTRARLPDHDGIKCR